MQKRLSREIDKTFPELVEKYNTDYRLSITDYSENSISISSNRYNCNVILQLPPQYPFKPPKIILSNLSNQSYEYWCSKILNKKDDYTIFKGSVLTYIAMPTLLGITKKPLDNKMCLCCESITCQSRWSPAHNIFTVFNECVYYKNIEHYLQPKYIRFFDHLFKNERWCLPDDIILTIIEFL